MDGRDKVNEHVAARLDEAAAILHDQGANPFRVRAYSQAAGTVRRLERPVSDILAEEGVEGLERLPTIGDAGPGDSGHRAPLAGRRVVRGREAECLRRAERVASTLDADDGLESGHRA